MPTAPAAIQETAADQSARRLLVDWANGQDAWVRQLVSEVLSARDECSEDVLDAVFEQFLIEKGLADGDPVKVPELELKEEAAGAAVEFSLTKLSGVEGVNALAGKQEIAFNPGLTILFGENAAGKTGYTRILKQLAAVRTAEPILPNVHDPSAPQAQKATVEYSLGGTEEALTWEGERGVAPFTHMGIFDSTCVTLHIDDELAYVYTPSDLSLFPHVTAGIHGIRTRLDSATSQMQPGTNPYLQQFTRGTPAYAAVETLGPATDLAELKKLASLPEGSGKKLEELEARVGALQSQAVDAQLTVARNRHDLHTRLLAGADAAGKFRATDYNEAVGAGAAAQREYEVLRRDISPAESEAADDETWERFILGGEAYREHLEKHDYPQEGDKCLYCEQPIGPEALKLLKRYRDFANDATRTRVNEAQQRADREAADVAAIDAKGLLEEVAKSEDESGDDALVTASAMLELLERNQAELARYKPVDWDETAAPAREVATKSQARAAAAETLTGNLTAKESERSAALDSAKAGLAELKDRIHLSKRIDEIDRYVTNAKWAQRASALAARFPQLLRSLTETSKSASERLLNSDFAKRFKAESEALRAPEVKLDFPGRQGKAARRKMVSASHKPSAVLSEGEQKVIALADFLAEASLRLTPAPIVFDDPVTSLDYRRIREVADRVSALAADRQVIVFTHNIWFTTELLSRFEKDKERCTYYSVTDEPSKGVVQRGTHPRWDTVKKTTGKINKAIQNARKHEGEEREAFIEQAYSHIRTWSEVAVEDDLLAGVTKRYAPNVMMTALPNIKTDRLDAAIAVILPVFEKACRIMEGHSQPLETLGVRPSLEELEEDWADLQQALEEYKKG
jgi:ABC-type transport system involved in cytochrome c biogenesis ATPase subunit